eukprot:6216001-Alexandrium_andersonii.AAC.1
MHRGSNCPGALAVEVVAEAVLPPVLREDRDERALRMGRTSHACGHKTLAEAPGAPKFQQGRQAGLEVFPEGLRFDGLLQSIEHH